MLQCRKIATLLVVCSFAALFSNRFFAPMSNRILLIAHAPLAQALAQCAAHVFPEAGEHLIALDIVASADPAVSLQDAQALLAGGGPVLVLSDVFGATPHNIAQELARQRADTRLIAGVNLPMLLRALCYRSEELDNLTARAITGGSQGIMQVTQNTPQNQNIRAHDQDCRHHQQ
jgi:PTS system mannose-specific IIA component